MKTEITIIIVNYNTANLLKKCIESVFKEKGTSIEIIVIDNASTDNSVEIVKKFQKNYPNITLRVNKKNKGFSYANNQGIRLAKSDYVLLLNSDTEVHKETFAVLLDFARKTLDAGVIGAKLLNSDGSIQPSCFRFPTIKNAVLQYWFGKKGLFDKYSPKKNSPSTVEAVVGAAFLITPQAIEKVGFLDERYFMYFEDVDYCRRVWKKDLKVYYLPGALVTHHHGASGHNIADKNNQWRRLIPSSKIYHGTVKHYVLNAILWSGQKWQNLKTAIRF